MSDFENPRVSIFIEIEEFFFLRAFGTDRKFFFATQGVNHFLHQEVR